MKTDAVRLKVSKRKGQFNTVLFVTFTKALVLYLAADVKNRVAMRLLPRGSKPFEFPK